MKLSAVKTKPVSKTDELPTTTQFYWMLIRRDLFTSLLIAGAWLELFVVQILQMDVGPEFYEYSPSWQSAIALALFVVPLLVLLWLIFDIIESFEMMRKSRNLEVNHAAQPSSVADPYNAQQPTPVARPLFE